MEIQFATPKLRKTCNDMREMVREFGKRTAEKLARRLEELAAADCLEDFRRLPQARCHELKGDRVGQLAVDLVHPKRLVFRSGEPVPVKPDGGLDWAKVTGVIVVEVVDYH